MQLASGGVVVLTVLGLAACASVPAAPPPPVSPTAQPVSYCRVSASIDPMEIRDEEQTPASRRWLHVWEGGQWLQDDGRYVNGRWVPDTRSNRAFGPTCTVLVMEQLRPDRPVVSTLFTGKGLPRLLTLFSGESGDNALYLNASRSVNGAFNQQADTITTTYYGSRYLLIAQDDGTIRLLGFRAAGAVSVVLKRAPFPPRSPPSR